MSIGAQLATIQTIATLTFAVVIAYVTTAADQRNPQPSASAEPPIATLGPGVTVGILREDAVLIPFATFDGQTWQNSWPVPSDDHSGRNLEQVADIPASWLGGRTLVTRWELLKVDGVRQQIRVTGVTPFLTHCVSNVGLLTDFTSRVQIEPNSFPLPYAGIAATAPNVLAPVRELASESRDSREIAGRLPAIFANLEPNLWSSIRDSKYEPLLTGTLPAPQLVSVYSSRLFDGREVIGFRARRELPRSVRGDQLESVTIVVGWFTRVALGALTLIDARASQSDIDGKGGDDELIPRAAAVVAGRTFWLGSANAYESEAYIVFEVGVSRPYSVVETFAGGC